MVTWKEHNSISEAYDKCMHTYHKLTAEEEKMLCKKMRDGDKDARKTLILSNLGLVISISGKFSKYNGLFEELFEEGQIALVKAVDNFDVSRGFKFSTYGTAVITKTIITFLLKKDGQRKYVMLTDKYRNVMNLRDQGYTIEDIAKKLQIGKKTVSHYILGFQKDLVQASLCVDEINQKIADHLTEEKLPITNEELEDMMSNLSEKEKYVFEHASGIGSYKTMQEMATSFGCSRANIALIYKKAIKKMRIEIEKGEEK